MGEGSLVWAAVQPVIKIVLMCGVGAYLGHKGIITDWGQKLLGNLLMKVFIPSLMIAKLGSTLSLSNLLNWWPASANVVVSTIIGGLLGWLNARLLRVPYKFRNHVICACALGNVGNIPLVFVPEVINGSKSVFGEVNQDLSMAYIMLGVWVAVVGLFSWGYKMLAPKKEQTIPQFQIQLTEVDSGLSSNSEKPTKNTLVPDQGTDSNSPENITRESSLEITNSEDKLTRQTSSRPFITQQTDHIEINNDSQQVQQSQSNNNQLLERIKNFIQKEILMYVNAPIISTVIALVIGISRPLQWVLFEDGAPLYIIGSTLRSFGDATIPAMMLLLGSTVVKARKIGQISKKTIAGVCITRLIIVPVVGALLMYFIITKEWIYMPDRVLPFVMLAQWIVPTAINLESIATIHQNQTVELSILLFWQYIFSIFTMPVFAYLFLNIVKQMDKI